MILIRPYVGVVILIAFILSISTKVNLPSTYLLVMRLSAIPIFLLISNFDILGFFGYENLSLTDINQVIDYYGN